MRITDIGIYEGGGYATIEDQVLQMPHDALGMHDSCHKLFCRVLRDSGYQVETPQPNSSEEPRSDLMVIPLQVICNYLKDFAVLDEYFWTYSPFYLNYGNEIWRARKEEPDLWRCIPGDEVCQFFFRGSRHQRFK